MPKIVDAEEYRKQMLDKCFDLFAQKGYGAITMREVAQELGVSTGTLYHYFPNKAALFEQLVEQMCHQDILRASMEIKKLKTITEKLIAVGEYISNSEDYFIKQLYVMVDFCQQEHFSFQEENQLFERIDRNYERAIAEVLQINDPAIASLINSLLNGLILQRLWGNQKISISEQMKLLSKMLIAYEKNRQEI